MPYKRKHKKTRGGALKNHGVVSHVAPHDAPHGAPHDAPHGAPHGAPHDAPHGAPRPSTLHAGTGRGKKSTHLKIHPASKKKAAFIEGKKFMMDWFNITRWLDFSKLFYIVGFIIAMSSIVAGSEDGLLVSYYWITTGVFVTLFLSLIVISMHRNITGIFDILKIAFPVVMPSMFLLAPLIALIYILTSMAGVLKKDPELPPIYSKMNLFVLAFIVFQCIVLSGFYKSEIKNLSIGHTDPNKWAYASGLILSTILTCAGVAELYVIITSFLTDG
jgi:hypothetical protein